MATTFIERSVKASWGIPCIQGADGRLWVGKGKECGFGEQFGPEEEDAVQEALERGRGNRNGHFWVDFKKRIVTMQVGAPYQNTHHSESF
jgi:hypothetical protein